MRKRLCAMLGERTLVIIKPDGIKRGLIGLILQRFERAGLKMVACKMITASRGQLEGHFPKDQEWVLGMGQKSLDSWKEHGVDPIEILGTTNPGKIGRKIEEWNYEYLMSGPILVMILQGIHAVTTVRKLVGDTSPHMAAPGTIRGDFAIDSPDLANVEGRAVHNVVHASKNIEEAEQEVANWFCPEEIQAHRKKSERR